MGGSSLGVILGLSRSSSWSTLRTLMKRLTRMAPKIMPIKIARVLRKGALAPLCPPLPSATEGLLGVAVAVGEAETVASGEGLIVGVGDGL